jgi:hypothetical protein
MLFCKTRRRRASSSTVCLSVCLSQPAITAEETVEAQRTALSLAPIFSLLWLCGHTVGWNR